MDYLKDTVLTNWHGMRWFRLGLGLFMGFQAIQVHDPLAGFIAVFFLYQAATNTGCCGVGVGGCAVPSSSAGKIDPIEEVEYEEIKRLEK